MIFHSLSYLIFLVVVFAIYWRLPLRGQNLFLLAASWFFYGCAHPAYLALLLTISITDFSMARLIVSRPDSKRVFLVISLLVNFGILAVFKYFGFFADNVVALLQAIGFNANPVTFRILLPVGVSFYVFQSSSYVIDTFRGKTRPTDRFFDYALFVSFFPQLVAGPIERASHLLAILQSPRTFNSRRIRDGFLLLLWGFFQKLVIADNVAAICNRAFSIEETSFPLLWSGVFAFGVQIYADFSAYTAIARGTARLLGIDLVRNFNHPYLSRSPAEFWRRWHISLSTWFRDYVYIPLGGSRKGPAREYINLFATFFISGLWHGAAWNFVIWGGFHGLLVVGQRFLERRGLMAESPANRMTSFGRWALTFLLVHIGWLLFREQNADYLWRAFTLNPFSVPSPLMWQSGIQDCLSTAFYALPLWLSATGEKWWLARGHSRFDELRPVSRFGLQAAACLFLFVGILLLGSGVSSDFIYFQF